MKTNMFELTSDIPAPSPKGSGVSKELTQLLRAMHIGDSFIAPKKGVNYYLAAKKLGMRVVTRSVNNNTIRVWRIRK